LPLVALGISTIFEGYQWTAFEITGVAAIMAGNLLILKKVTVHRRACYIPVSLEFK